MTGKPEGVDGGRVEEMVLAGQIEEVARYCESDVLSTYRVWLVYELFQHRVGNFLKNVGVNIGACILKMSLSRRELA